MRKEVKYDVLCLPLADLFTKEPGMEKVIDYVEKYKYVLIKNELSLDALKHELCDVVNRINAEHPKRNVCNTPPVQLTMTVPYVSRLMS